MQGMQSTIPNVLLPLLCESETLAPLHLYSAVVRWCVLELRGETISIILLFLLHIPSISLL